VHKDRAHSSNRAQPGSALRYPRARLPERWVRTNHCPSACVLLLPKVAACVQDSLEIWSGNTASSPIRDPPFRKQSSILGSSLDADSRGATQTDANPPCNSQGGLFCFLFQSCLFLDDFRLLPTTVIKSPRTCPARLIKKHPTSSRVSHPRGGMLSRSLTSSDSSCFIFARRDATLSEATHDGSDHGLLPKLTPRKTMNPANAISFPLVGIATIG
jgi:hypothetical protein